MRRMIMLGFVCLVIAAPVQAGQKIIQIGGGNKIDNSQGQIEDNVIWLSEILNKSSSDIVNYFASGEGDEKDVSLYDTSGVSSSMEVISRVFEDGDANRLVFKHNDVPGLSGGTNKKELTKSITSVLENVASEQEILLIFNGHGGHDRRDERNNTLKIWGDERLNVSEVDKILDHAPDKSTIRFIFPQCYSGGFYYLIFDDPFSDRLSSQNRCGFFAESAMEESEGCSLNTNRDEYRDYSNYFFAPLNGETRNGEPLPISADMDRDGTVSYRESHFYALMVGESKDLSRSTSEIFLEDWAPWYLRWGYAENKESDYWKIAEYVARKHKLSLNGKDLREAKKILQISLDKTLSAQKGYIEEINKLSSAIKAEVVKKWPEANHPYTSRYVSVIENQIDDISSYIQSLQSYTELIHAQNGLADMNRQELDLERKKSQIDKIQRMKMLARLEKQFVVYADKTAKQTYQRLIDCEGGRFFTP